MRQGHNPEPPERVIDDDGQHADVPLLTPSEVEWQMGVSHYDLSLGAGYLSSTERFHVTGRAGTPSIVVRYRAVPATRFGEMVRQARAARNMGQVRLAELSRYSKAYISHIETGKAKQPSIAAVLSIAEVLGLNAREALEAAGWETRDDALPMSFHDFIALDHRLSPENRETLTRLYDMMVRGTGRS